MIGLLLVSHGKMAEGVLDSMALITGEPENTDFSSLVAGQDYEVFKKDVAEKIKKLDQGQGVLVFVDLYGASPYNAAMMSLQELTQEGYNYRVITGFNLPMVLEISAMRVTDMALEELAALAENTGREGIQNPVAELLTAETEDEDEY